MAAIMVPKAARIAGGSQVVGAPADLVNIVVGQLLYTFNFNNALAISAGGNTKST
jgi:hypothetical protein